jgi:hypothetical protein
MPWRLPNIHWQVNTPSLHFPVSEITFSYFYRFPLFVKTAQLFRLSFSGSELFRSFRNLNIISD